MYSGNERIILPEGIRDVRVVCFERNDISLLYSIYQNWYEYNRNLLLIGGKRVSLSPDFVEAVLALRYGYYKIADYHVGFDCYNANPNANNRRVEIKFSMDSFGTIGLSNQQEWDCINYARVYAETPQDCFFQVFEIEREQISNYLGWREDYYHNHFNARRFDIRQFLDVGLCRQIDEFALSRLQ